ncbi:MAG: TRAP transporter large permease, partial [Proteobacteria bacterium]|nr:TRAP transporter large permease [Pseudomonadota bacterium]
MEWYWAVLLLLGPVIVMMALGVPVAWTFIATNIIGTLVLGGSFASLIQVVDNSTSLLTRFTLAPV